MNDFWRGFCTAIGAELLIVVALVVCWFVYLLISIDLNYRYWEKYNQRVSKPKDPIIEEPNG